MKNNIKPVWVYDKLRNNYKLFIQKITKQVCTSCILYNNCSNKCHKFNNTVKYNIHNIKDPNVKDYFAYLMGINIEHPFLSLKKD